MAAPLRARCPSCRQPVSTEKESRPKDFPFCSERCRLLDLQRWFRGDFAIPVIAETDPEELERLAAEAGLADPDGRNE